MRRRDAFVGEVAKTLCSHHGVERESFVFGLSGRWGEGKTHFLERLRVVLQAEGFEVIDLNPWKYAADRVAFLRAFLVRLLEEQSRRSRAAVAWQCLRHGRFTDAWDMAIPRRFLLARLRADVTR
jgi:predicted KAP-like P-loop ATPase